MKNNIFNGSIEIKRFILDEDSKNIFKNTNYLSLCDSEEIEIGNGSIIPIQKNRIPTLQIERAKHHK